MLTVCGGDTFVRLWRGLIYPIWQGLGLGAACSTAAESLQWQHDKELDKDEFDLLMYGTAKVGARGLIHELGSC